MYNIIDIVGGSLIFIVLIVGLVRHKFTPKNLNKRYYSRRWQSLQKMCVDKKLWYKALIDADNLLDKALKEMHFKGKTTGERLVAAQRHLSSNDSVWFSHKLTNKLKESGSTKLSKKETVEALSSFRLALKDLGALSAERKAKSTNGRK